MDEFGGDLYHSITGSLSDTFSQEVVPETLVMDLSVDLVMLMDMFSHILSGGTQRFHDAVYSGRGTGGEHEELSDGWEAEIKHLKVVAEQCFVVEARWVFDPGG